MSAQGQQIFSDALSGFSARRDDPELAKLAERVAAPLRIAVRGRRGVGAGTVSAALAAAGYQIVAERPDLVVRVLAEVCKPEDQTDRPDVLLLNKADLAGRGAGGPLLRARQQAARLTASRGVPACAFVAPLARAAVDPDVVDDELVAALRVLVTEPGDLTSPDAFVGAAHRLPRAARQRLVETLDLFGIAHAVIALRDDPAVQVEQLRRMLGAVSGIDQARAAIDDAGCAVGYQRIVAVCTTLQRRAATDAVVAEFLTADSTVLARMSAAVDVVTVLGARVDPADTPAAHLARALTWRTYGSAPLLAVARSCSADIVRGSLRLLHQAAA